MAAIDDIKSGLDINQLASMLGTDPATADQAVQQALGSLLGAMGNNVADEGAALGLARAALGDHNTGLLDGGIDLGAIDTTDGNKILSHVYSPDQIQRLGGGVQGGLLQKLLPLLAPIVMAYLAKQLNGAISGGAQQRQQQGGGSILDDILGSVLGGQAPQQTQQKPSSSGSGSIFGDILGSVFGSEPQAAPAPAPQQRAPQTPADGPFSAPSGGTGDLRMDDGSNDAPASYPTGGGQPQMGGLGDLLRQILVGR